MGRNFLNAPVRRRTTANVSNGCLHKECPTGRNTTSAMEDVQGRTYKNDEEVIVKGNICTQIK